MILLLGGQNVNRKAHLLLGDVSEVPATGTTAWMVDVASAASPVSIVLPGIAVDDDNTSLICLHLRWNFCCRLASLNVQ